MRRFILGLVALASATTGVGVIAAAAPADAAYYCSGYWYFFRWITTCTALR